MQLFFLRNVENLGSVKESKQKLILMKNRVPLM